LMFVSGHIVPGSIKLGVVPQYPDAEIGSACTGGSWWYGYAGSCQQEGLECYSSEDLSRHAGKGAPGQCLVAHQKECSQQVPGNESSGGCRGNTVCRHFEYRTYSPYFLPHPETIHAADVVQHKKSYCIDTANAGDRALMFVSGHIVPGSLHTVVASGLRE